MTRTLFVITAILLLPTAALAQSFDTLARRLDAGDRLRVEVQAGDAISGRFVRADADTITIDAGAGERTFARSDVRTIRVRARSAGRGALAGLGGGMVWGAALECTGGKNSECPDAVLMVGGLGAGLGAIVGAFIPRTTTVYAAPGAHASFAPVIAQHAIGIQARIRW
ncbi:MAG TPA: hypothetical protein VLU46_02860 [Thermoanaerobaculia bacterium]|nr:hypothetical protein [Thermoanaerobaculia bacterium]